MNEMKMKRVVDIESELMSLFVEDNYSLFDLHMMEQCLDLVDYVILHQKF